MTNGLTAKQITQLSNKQLEGLKAELIQGKFQAECQLLLTSKIMAVLRFNLLIEIAEYSLTLQYILTEQARRLKAHHQTLSPEHCPDFHFCWS